MHLIPQSWSHLHMLVGVFPSFGLALVLGFYVAGFLTSNDGIKRTCLILFGLLALLSFPTYLSGTGSVRELAADPKISKAMIATHTAWALAGRSAGRLLRHFRQNLSSSLGTCGRTTCWPATRKPCRGSGIS